MAITVDIKTALAIYTLVPAAVIGMVWFISESFKRSLRFRLEKKFLWQCDVCTYIYINIKEDVFSVCPRCGSYNKKAEAKLQKTDDNKTTL